MPPTQPLTGDAYAATTALAPTAANLVLFFQRLPAATLIHTGTATTVLQLAPLGTRKGGVPESIVPPRPDKENGQMA